MINSRVVNNTIRISLSKNQLIDLHQFRRLFRTGLRLSEQHGGMPIIVDTERNVHLSSEARTIFRRLNSRCITTLVIISG